jgi:hypothetical protein
MLVLCIIPQLKRQIFSRLGEGGGTRTIQTEQTPSWINTDIYISQPVES